MTVTLDIITDAYRESNINGIGVVPTAPQQTEGLRLLNSVVSSVYGFEVGEALRDWPIGTVGVNGDPNWSADQWVRPVANVRLLWDSQIAQTIYLPNEVSDGARIAIVDVLGNLATYSLTLDGNGRKVGGNPTLVLNTDGLVAMFMYRADLADWVRLDPIADVDDAFPFPSEFDAAFITMLAMRLNPRYGRSLAGESGAWMTRSLGQLRARYRQRVVVGADMGVLTNTPKGYSPWTGGGHQRHTRGWM